MRGDLSVDVRAIERAALAELRRHADVRPALDVRAHQALHELRRAGEDERAAHHRRRVAVGEAHAAHRADRVRILRVEVRRQAGDEAFHEKLHDHVGLADAVMRTRVRRVVDLHRERTAQWLGPPAVTGIPFSGQHRDAADDLLHLVRWRDPGVGLEHERRGAGVVERADVGRAVAECRDRRGVGLAVLVPVAGDEAGVAPRQHRRPEGATPLDVHAARSARCRRHQVRRGCCRRRSCTSRGCRSCRRHRRPRPPTSRVPMSKKPSGDVHISATIRRSAGFAAGRDRRRGP